MNFLNSGDVVEKPCKDVLTHPIQCFQELFLATPGIVVTFFVGIGGFLAAVAIWGAIFGAALYIMYLALKHIWAVGKCVFTQTKLGQKIAQYVPNANCLQRFCCRGSQLAQDAQPKKLINTQAIGDTAANLVSKVNVDTKWFKGAFKNFSSKTNEQNSKSGEVTSNQSTPAKSPSKSTSRIASILSPKTIKQS